MNPTQRSAPAPAVPLLDIGRGNRSIRDEVLRAWEEVYDSGRFLFGPAVERLERAVADLSGTRHAIGCASGSDAILLALMAIDVGPGDEVIVPSFTFFATASAVWRLGAKPIFVDIDPKTFNVHPDLVEQAITSETRAIIPVHLFGQCAPMDVLADIAQTHGIALIEDAAQAIGAAWHDRPAGSWGLAGCLSFYPTKNLGGAGDGGMLTTNDDALADRLRRLASHGMRPRYYHRDVGINSRLDTLQAALLEVKLRRLDAWTESRRVNAHRYGELMEHAGAADWIEVPFESPNARHVWNQYTIRVRGGRRDALRQWLAERGVGSEIYYPVPLHLQECFRPLGYQRGDLPATELAADEVLSLPIFPELSDQEIQTVVRAVAAFGSRGLSAAA
ncbi:MAG: DegT/DnrJ/EryC1/StrS family aminotransferase [Planctomycetes bacterium]|nr:DegT/DnrJ/EryC1/StrS family aminotransferase [Planctomycetota bacterium]